MRKLASIQKIVAIKPVANSDNLDVVKVLGWECVAKRGEFKEGQLVIYVEIDSILPDVKIFEFFRKRSNRVKTIRLRGQVSQGLVLGMEVLEEFGYELKMGGILDDTRGIVAPFEIGTEVTELLKIEKYVPYIPACLSGEVKGVFPSCMPKTDEERIQNIPDLIEQWQGKKCYISEKIDGSSCTMAIIDGEFNVCSRNMNLKETEGNSFWKLARELDIENKLKTLGCNVAIQGELWGCFRYGTPVRLADGTTEMIGNIVNNKKKLEVLTYNFDTNKLENKRIVAWKKYKSTNNWITIGYARKNRGGKACDLVLTKNHKVFVENLGKIKEIEAGDIKEGDNLLTFNKKVSYVQKQILLGSLIGDSSYADYAIHCGHSLKQEEYVNFKIKMLNSLITNVYFRTSGKGSKMKVFSTKTLPEFREIAEDLFVNGKKDLTIKYLDKLHPLALAVWYMDDGSLHVHNKRGHNDTCSLFTNNFSIKQVEKAIEWFNIKGYFCYLLYNDKKPVIKFTPEGTLAFQATIAPYIIKSMRYKLSNIFKNVPSFWTRNNPFADVEIGLVTSKVKSVTEGVPKSANRNNSMSYMYDLTIEGNSNYFANNILVHNSGIQSNKYKVDKINFSVFNVFNIDQYKYLNYHNFRQLMENLKIPIVPIISDNFEIKHSVEDLVALSQNVSKINNAVQREGIVIRSLEEERVDGLGRLSFKVISPSFLLKYKE